MTGTQNSRQREIWPQFSQSSLPLRLCRVKVCVVDLDSVLKALGPQVSSSPFPEPHPGTPNLPASPGLASRHRAMIAEGPGESMNLFFFFFLATGISYQRLVRAEQGLPIRSHRSSTV